MDGVDAKNHQDGSLTDMAVQLKAQGYSVKMDPVLGAACGPATCRPDMIARDPNGQVVIIELKTGDADLSVRQREIFPQIENGRSVPGPDLAARIRILAGIPLKDQGYPNGIPIFIKRAPGLKQS